MKNEYSYMRQVSYLDSFSVDNIGNCVIQTFNDEGQQSFLMIRTVLGVSRILECGPIQDGKPTQCYCSFTQMDYDDRRVDKVIQGFIGSRQDTTQVNVFNPETREDYEKFTNDLPDIREYLYD